MEQGATVVHIISRILQAAETARENRKKCEELAYRVSMIADLLPQLQLDQDVMPRPLAGLDDTLREAHELVLSCQGRSPAYRFFMAGRQARRFRDVQSRIDSYLLVFPVISHIAIVRRLDRIYHVQLANHAVLDGSAEEELTFPEIMPSSTNNNNVAFDTTLCATGAASTACKGGTSSRLHDEREVAVLSPLRLKHIVRLSRWLVEKEKLLLVCEYVNNGTLRHHINGDGGEGRPSSSPSPVMACWRIRVEVLLGVSRAMAHLHRSTVPPVQRDASSCNILLDASWTPRVSDFSTSWHGTNVQGMDDGTGGHLVPAAEHYRTGRLKPASDVYNLGVVMLEVLTGKRPTMTNWDEQRKSEVAMSLVCFALPFIDAGQLAKVLDGRPPAPEPTPRQLAALEQVAQAAARCLREEVEDRPPISDVVAHLERALKLIFRA